MQIAWANNYNTAQIYKTGVEMALCSDDNKQISTFVYCKDFFQDAIVAFLHGTICNIYSYKYDPKSMPPIPQQNLKVLIANSADPKLAEKIPAVADFLHQIEEKLGVQLTTVEQCENPPEKYASGIYLLTADKIWMHAPPLLSLWTLLARNSLVHKVGEKWETTIQGIMDSKIEAAQKNDQVFITFGKPGLDLLLEKGIKALFGEDMKANYPVERAGNTMHHFSGIVSYGSCKARPYFPNWQYPAVETNPPSICFA